MLSVVIMVINGFSEYLVGINVNNQKLDWMERPDNQVVSPCPLLQISQCDVSVSNQMVNSRLGFKIQLAVS